jgi:hypothetical protein
MATAKPKVLPKTIGQMVDFIAILQEEQKQLQAVADEKDSEVRAAIAHLEANFDVAELDGATGKLGVAARKPTMVANVTNWDLFYAWIAKKKAWDCLHRRVGSTAVASRWENGETIPGVEQATVWKTVVKPIKKAA